MAIPHRATAVSVSAIALFLIVLYFLPALIQKKTFAFHLDAKNAQPGFILPMDQSFAVIHSAKKMAKQMTLRQCMGTHDQVIINFWATWCPPCLEELPSLEMLERLMHRNQSPELPPLVTLSVDNKATDVPKLFSTLDFRATLLVMHDNLGKVAISLGIRKFPETFLVDKNGNIIHKWVGPQDWFSDDVLRILVHAPNTNAPTY